MVEGVCSTADVCVLVHLGYLYNTAEGCGFSNSLCGELECRNLRVNF